MDVDLLWIVVAFFGFFIGWRIYQLVAYLVFKRYGPRSFRDAVTLLIVFACATAALAYASQLPGLPVFQQTICVFAGSAFGAAAALETWGIWVASKRRL
jgi:hypothetical protein